VKQPLLGFLAVARSAGIAASTSATIDAFAALELIGYGDRTAVKDALRLVLAKNDDERERFEHCFERYFAGDEARIAPPSAGPDLAADAAELPAVRAAVAASPLAQVLLADDRATLVRNLHAAAAEANVGQARLFTQLGAFTRRILERLGIASLDEAIGRLRSSGDPAEGRVADFLEGRRRAVRELARDLVERRLARTVDERDRLRDEFLRDARLSNVERRDIERMRVLVREMARRLATRYGRMRRRARRGHLDVRHTMRDNVAFDGIPFRVHWKQHRIERPRIVVLCDVSGSVAPLAQFLLLFVHGLTEALAGVRSFAFSNELLEVTELLERETLDDAIAKIMTAVGFRSSDYGSSLAAFAERHLALVDRKTTVIILGDGRTNYGNPRVDVVRMLADRAKRLVWLNPENRVAWGMDDSEMLRYQPHCHVATVCNRLRDLERVANELLSL